MSVPSVEYDGRTLIMTPHGAGRVSQPGAMTVILSQAEVEATVGSLERYIATNFNPAKMDIYKAKLSAYKQLLVEG